MIIEPKYLDARQFENDRAFVKNENELWSIIDETGEQKTDFKYYYIWDFREGWGCGCTKKNYSWEYISDDGVIYNFPNVRRAYRYYNEITPIYFTKKGLAFVNVHGKLIKKINTMIIRGVFLVMVFAVLG